MNRELCVNSWMCVCVCVCVSVSVSVCVFERDWPCLWLSVCSYIYSCVCVCVCLSIFSVHFKPFPHLQCRRVMKVFVCAQVCVWALTCICLFMCMCLNMNVYASVCVCLCVCLVLVLFSALALQLCMGLPLHSLSPCTQRKTEGGREGERDGRREEPEEEAVQTHCPDIARPHPLGLTPQTHETN